MCSSRQFKIVDLLDNISIVKILASMIDNQTQFKFNIACELRDFNQTMSQTKNYHFNRIACYQNARVKQNK